MSLLPRNTTVLERNLEKTSLRFKHSPVIQDLWNGSTCPVTMLPWLAWAVSVDDWDSIWSVERKRNAINESIYIHEHKGTPSSIKRTLSIHGHADAILVERSSYFRYDGKNKYNGHRSYGGRTQWATFKVILNRPISNANAQALLRAINTVKRNCCHLIKLDYQQAAWRYDGTVQFDGAYTYGVINI